MQCLSKNKPQHQTVASPPYIQTGLREDQKNETGYKSARKMAATQIRTRFQSQKETSSNPMGSIEDMMKESKGFVNPEDFLKSNEETKLMTLITSMNKLHAKFDTLNEDLYKEEEGFVPRLGAVEADISDVQNENAQLRSDLKIIKGVVQRQEEKIASITDQLIELTGRSMAENLVFSGVHELRGSNSGGKKEEQNEDCVITVKEFLQQHLDINASADDIYTAFRMGEFVPGKKKPRQILAKFHPALKERILADKAKLAKVDKDIGGPFYINIQEPESYVAKRKENSHHIKKIKETNKSIPKKEDKVKYSIKKRDLYVDSVLIAKSVSPPLLQDLFVDQEEQDKMDKLKLIFADVIEEKGNIFTPIAVKTQNIAEVRRAYRKVKQLYPGATHIPMAYENQKKTGNQDDGEYGAGLVLQKVLEDTKTTNKTVFVIRNYNKKLGSKRFELFEEAAKSVLSKMK